jgi:type I restriction enzyme, R subunit
MMTDKMSMSEEDIKNQFISPAVFDVAGWLKSDARMEYSYTDGRINVIDDKPRRGKRKSVDYLLFYKPNFPIAVIEAKDRKKHADPGAGLQQGIDYAKDLNVPFVYASNGDAFVEHDLITGKEQRLDLDSFPKKEELWKRYKEESGLTPAQEKVISEPYYSSRTSLEPRYYQRIAINRTVEAVANGRNKILLVMATGTGKTYTAFQIVWRLLKSGVKKHILYLADRNVLVDQAMSGDFGPLLNKESKVVGGKLDSSYPILFALYHQLAGREGDDGHEPFRQLKADFFDLIIVDEAHRGSAKENSRWRKILEYFDGPNVTQIGMTATPKNDSEASNIDYFGEPIYTYSLKQGIEDGFLAPYKVIRVNLDVDVNKYRPKKNQKDANGRLIPDKEYTSRDFDRTLVIDDRTKQVAHYFSDYLKKNNCRFDKSIIFCEDIEHAERMRQALVNENSDLCKEDSRYVMRITGDDKVGKAQISNFQDIQSKYPTLVTTSKLLTTGVNVKTCKFIVLDSNINSMTDFKQIIGRGTRIAEEYGKSYFTIVDFRGVSRLFADPAFDGEPLEVVESKPNSGGSGGKGSNIGEPDPKYFVKDQKVKVLSDHVQYLNASGKLITISLTDYTKTNVLNKFATLDEFLATWKTTDKKQELLDELEENGIYYKDLVKDPKYQNMDPFDLLLYLAYNQKPMTKAERIKNVKKSGLLDQYQGAAREVLETLLEKYKNDGISDVEDINVLNLPEFEKFGGPVKIIFTLFGGKDKYQKTIKQMEEKIYS